MLAHFDMSLFFLFRADLETLWESVSRPVGWRRKPEAKGLSAFPIIW
jgi:hypothetical protein